MENENNDNGIIIPEATAPVLPDGMEPAELAQFCAQVCEETKAQDIQVFDVSEKSSVVFFYVVCTGTSMPHIRAIADHVRRAMAEKGARPRGQDGDVESKWVVLDYGVLIVHVLEPEMRAHYALEELWDKAHKGIVVEEAEN